jgi:hypothetical protein
MALLARIVGDINSRTDPVYVIVEADDSQRVEGPCVWGPRPPTDTGPLPSDGDPCWVALDDQARCVVMNWWPGELPQDT